jgi:hypothetical protein
LEANLAVNSAVFVQKTAKIHLNFGLVWLPLPILYPNFGPGIGVPNRFFLPEGLALGRFGAFLIRIQILAELAFEEMVKGPVWAIQVLGYIKSTASR